MTHFLTVSKQLIKVFSVMLLNNMFILLSLQQLAQWFKTGKNWMFCSWQKKGGKYFCFLFFISMNLWSWVFWLSSWRRTHYFINCWKFSESCVYVCIYSLQQKEQTSEACQFLYYEKLSGIVIVVFYRPRFLCFLWKHLTFVNTLSVQIYDRYK